MIRGTTAPFKIKLPCTLEDVEWLTIKWWQDGNNGTLTAPLPITKKLKHCLSNIYVCTLSSNIIKNEQYYFTVNDIVYTFTAPQDVSACNVLKYDEVDNVLTDGTFVVAVSVVEYNVSVGKLTFINESYLSNYANVSLTAFETMRFSDRHKAKVQFRGKRKSNGKIFGCQPQLLTVYPINDDLLGDDIIGSETDNGWIVLDGQSVIGGD